MKNKRFELVIVWSTGEREVYGFNTYEAAAKARRNMEIAFGSQLWACINERRVFND